MGACSLEDVVEPSDQPCGAAAQILLERGPLGLEVAQRGHRGRHGQRVLAERSRGEGRLDSGVRRVTVVPVASVDAVHESAAVRDGANGHAATEHLAVGDQVRLDAVPRLSATRMEPEASDDLVEDEGHSCFTRHRPQRLEEGPWLEIGTAALHGFDEDARQFVKVLADELQRAVLTVGQHEDVLDDLGRHARRHGQRLGLTVDHASHHQRAVGVAVVGAGEHHDFRAARRGARQPERRHHRLRAGVAEGDALHPGQLAEQFRGLPAQVRLGAQLHALRQTLLQRLHDEGRVVTEQVHPEAHGEVDVLVAVRVPDPRALRTHADDGVADLLQLGAEVHQPPHVAPLRPVADGCFLRALRARGVLRDERVQVTLLYRGEFSLGRAGLGSRAKG